MAKKYDMEYLKTLARAGAESTLKRLREEIAILERTFPELSTAKGRGKAAAGVKKGASNLTAAGRASISRRMKKYWAERRKAAKAG